MEQHSSSTYKTTLETSEEDVDKTTHETSEEDVDKTTLETSKEDVDKTTLETSEEYVKKTTLETSVVSHFMIFDFFTNLIPPFLTNFVSVFIKLKLFRF